MQPDPIGFRGDRSNLYRYCRNNPVKWSDPSGLERGTYWPLEGMASVPEVIVTGAPTGGFGPDGVAGPGDTASAPDDSRGPYGELGAIYDLHNIPFFLRAPEDDEPASPSTQQPAPSNVPSQNPPQPTLPSPANIPLWQVILITAFNDPIGDHDNPLGPGNVATADLRYRTSDLDSHNRPIHVYHGTPIRAYPRGSAVTIYRQDGTVYSGTITDTGPGFAARRPAMGLPNGVPGTLWFDIWTPTGSENPEWDLVLIQFPSGN